MSDPLRPRGLQPTRLLRPWDFPGKSTGVGFHFLLQGIFLTQGSNPGLLHCRQTLYPLSHQGSPTLSWYVYPNQDANVDALLLAKLQVLCLNFTSFPICIFSLFQEPAQGATLHFVVTSPRSPLGCDTFSISVFFMTLTVLGSTGQAFCRMLLSLDFSNVFFMVILKS